VAALRLAMPRRTVSSGGMASMYGTTIQNGAMRK
jgi:hypothetical protein